MEGGRASERGGQWKGKDNGGGKAMEEDGQWRGKSNGRGNGSGREREDEFVSTYKKKKTPSLTSLETQLEEISVIKR